MHVLALILTTLLALDPLAPGDHTRTLEHGGRTRTYIVHVPPKYDSKQPTPAVLAFHGGGSNAEQVVRFCGLNEKADRESFIVVYPNGTGRVERMLTWNGGNCCADAMLNNVDDVGFTRSLLDDLATVTNVDAKRIFATGISNGGIMCYRLASELSDRIAATGGSAGAGLSLWLGFHDDLADPSNADPVLRESTKLRCMSVNAGQTSYDPRFIRDLFPGTNVYKIGALAQLFDSDPNKLDELSKEKCKLFEECSPITHLTKDDPPAQLIAGMSMDQADIHSPRFGKALKEKMDALGIRCAFPCRFPVVVSHAAGRQAAEHVRREPDVPRTGHDLRDSA